MVSLLTAAGQDRSDVVGQLFQEPLIDKSIDLAGFFVPFIVGICTVYQTDKSYSQSGKQTVDVLLYQFQLTGKSGLAFTKDDIEFSGSGIQDQTVKFRPISISTGIIIVTIDVMYSKPEGHAHQVCKP